MKKQRTRSEIDSKYKWDLTTIFKTDEDAYKALEELKGEIDKIDKFKGHILDSATSLLEFLKQQENFERKLYKVYYYASLKFDEDTTNVKYQELKGKVYDVLTIVSEKTSFITPEMLNTPYEVVLKYIDELEKLKDYRHNLEDMYRMQDHKLSEEEERLLSIFSPVIASPRSTYNTLTDSDMKFGNINVDGEEVELTESNYTLFLHSKDRNVRKLAFDTMYKVYSSYKNTISNTFAANVDSCIASAKIYNFKNSLEASLFSDNVDISIYNNLIDTVSKNINVLDKYYALKKKILKLDEMHFYDMYVDLVGEVDKNYSFEEAKDLVVDALSILGDDYITNFKKAFTEGWIDVYNNVGKRSGAYSSGFYDTNPFILLNYEGKLRDVSTLAHEGGHSMHTYYSCSSNSYNNSDYSIFVAEVASTVNELLLLKHLAENAKTKEEKLYALNELMELFKGTIYRQTMFAEFERDMHKFKENGEVLTNEFISNHYYDLNKKYYEKELVVDDLIRYEWERIPHFYSSFYVYKYAIGMSSACFIVNNILSGDEKAKENYLKFLKSGGSVYPVDALKLALVDPTKSEVVESALSMFNDIIDEFEKLYFEV